MSIQLQQKLLEHCVAGTTARAALFVGVQANTPKLFLQRVRRLIASTQGPTRPWRSGESARLGRILAKSIVTDRLC
ncbi:MAG: hypothetical protein CCU26_08590 [Nitrospira sp. UW-LDO-01]|nr:MAG: hypothetical protein CCU26_08590 [Nitrospira sp. UW-LDO-01]